MPLPPPANYTFANAPDPTETLRKNIEMATTIANAQRQAQLAPLQQQAAQLQVQQAQQQAAAQQLAIQQQQQFQSDLQALPASPTASDVAGVLRRNPTKYAEIKGFTDALSPMQNNAELKMYSPIHAAMISATSGPAENRPAALAAVADRIDASASALENTGNAQDAQHAQELRGLGKTFDEHPGAAIALSGAHIAGLMGLDKYAENFKTLSLLPDQQKEQQAKATTEQAAADVAKPMQAAALKSAQAKATTEQATAGLAGKKAQADLDNVTSEIAARGLTGDLAKKKFALEESLNTAQIKKIDQEMGTPPPEISKQMGDLSGAYNKAMMNAKIADDLAAKIPKILTGFAKSGAPATVDEAIKAAAGTGDQATVLRKQLTQFITEEMLSKLPPGAARSPEMLATIKGGFANANASADVLIPMLQAAGQQQRQAAATAKFQKNWLGLNRSPGAARTDFPINGLQVKAGEDPDEILQNKVLPQITGQTAAAAAPGAAAAGPSPAQLQMARQYLTHKDADPKKAAAIRAKYGAWL